MMVCPRQRANLGKYWGNQTRRTPCQYPEHKGKLEGVESDRAFTVKLAKEVKDLFCVIFPVGSREYLIKIYSTPKQTYYQGPNWQKNKWKVA